jgi:CheY-like chemotaxis protein
MADDEGIVRCTTQRILGRLGYDVLATADGIEATDRFREHQRDVRIVLLDLTMPRLDGWGALKAIRELRPRVPVILASGHDEAQVLRGHPADPSLVFLHKPYAVDDLRLALERANAAIAESAAPHNS